MQQTVSRRTQRLKLVALMALFAIPLLVAWGMVQWRVGIPEQRTAHGELAPRLPYLAEWPLLGPHDAIDDGDWILAFDCTRACDQVADRWWRLHRALGREAPRVTRLRITAPGQAGESLAGEVIAEWREVPAWQSPGRVWVADPRGEVVLSYAGEVELRDVMSDLSHLLRMNPEVRLKTERDQT